MTKLSEEKVENIMTENEKINQLKTIEKFYIQDKIEDMLMYIEKKKDEMAEEISQYAKKNEKCVKWNKDGDEIAWKVEVKPLVIQNYFFKSITPINCEMPQYNGEKLALVYEYYNYLIATINDEIGNYPPSLTSFCKLSGLTLNELKSYRNSADYSLRTITEKIFDEIGDTNLTLSQLGKTNERSTIFKMKTQNEMVEKVQPKVNINIVEQPDMTAINDRINKYKYFATKKENE